MKLETGNPTIEGRYVVFVVGFKGWLEPYIVIWHKGKWMHRCSSQLYPDAVHCWSGPIPVVKHSPIEAVENLEYDL